MEQSTLSTINASVNNQIEITKKVILAKQQADQVLANARTINQLRKQATQDLISKKEHEIIELNQFIGDLNKKELAEAEESYNKELIALGLRKEDYPFMAEAVKTADKAAAGFFGLIGKGLKAAETAIDYTKSKVDAGRKS